MGIISLYEQKPDNKLLPIIEMCKSESGICGYKLRNAHLSAGQLMGSYIAFDNPLAERFAVVIMMRAGLQFGIGIADGLEISGKCTQIHFSCYEEEIVNDFKALNYDKIILVDAVIKTGASLLALDKKINLSQKTIFATNVLDKLGEQSFLDKQLYTIRISKHSFIGSKQKNIKNEKGPDTGDRLFNSYFMEKQEVK